jgi:uncharacterized protein GlcG (DUF336 family)/ketosteroid isomerase-like protein
MMRTKRLTVLLGVGLVFAALMFRGSGPAVTAQSTQAAALSIAEATTVITSFANAINTGNLDGAMTFFADDATFTDPEGHVSTGKDGITNVFREQIRLQNKLNVVNIQVSGDTATWIMQTTSGSTTLEADAKAVIQGGKFRSLVVSGQRPLGQGTAAPTGAATVAVTQAATVAVTATTARTATLVPSPAGPTPTVNVANVSAACRGLPDHNTLRAALSKARAEANGGFNLDMWATIVNRDGVVCAVAFTGQKRGDQWPGSRVISAQKANTANAFSLDSLALSTANLFSAVQPGGSLFGLQESNPVDTQVAYGGDPNNYGQANDPMAGRRIGGVNVFGGGLALYGPDKTVLGGLGVSGDSSCADHNIAWKTRFFLNLDNIPGGVNPPGNDNIIYDITVDANGRSTSASGWGHPVCSPDATNIAKALPDKFPVGPNP